MEENKTKNGDSQLFYLKTKTHRQKNEPSSYKKNYFKTYKKRGSQNKRRIFS